MRLYEEFSCSPAVIIRNPRLADYNMPRIAVIGTGIDLENPYVRTKHGPIKATRDFVKGGEDVSDHVGLGTKAVNLLLRLVPKSPIYVAKVTNDGYLSDLHPVAEVDINP
jgi:hypothetical protein